MPSQAGGRIRRGPIGNRSRRSGPRRFRFQPGSAGMLRPGQHSRRAIAHSEIRSQAAPVAPLRRKCRRPSLPRPRRNRAASFHLPASVAFSGAFDHRPSPAPPKPTTVPMPLPEMSARSVTVALALTSVVTSGAVVERAVLAPRPASMSPTVDQMISSPPTKVRMRDWLTTTSLRAKIPMLPKPSVPTPPPFVQAGGAIRPKAVALIRSLDRSSRARS